MSTRQDILDRTHLITAYNYSILSKCERAKVGAVIVRDNRIISVGYNGLPANSKCDCCENDDNTTKELVVHAERNAIDFAAKYGVSIDGCSLYVTMSPCIKCAISIIQSGIKRVVFSEQYRDTQGIETLLDYGIEVNQIEITYKTLKGMTIIK